MNSTEKRFLQVILLLLALLFTATVRYLADTAAVQTSTVANSDGAVTVSAFLEGVLDDGR